MPQIDAHWDTNGLVLNNVNLLNSISDGNGIIRDIRTATIFSNDVNISDTKLIITSYPGNVGMSGGPMLDSNDSVIGLMSIGLPVDVTIKEFLGAIWINEIINTI